MNPFRRRRRPVAPGPYATIARSLPRIPVTEQDPAGHWQPGRNRIALPGEIPDAGAPDAETDAAVARLGDELAALRKMIAALGEQLEDSNAHIRARDTVITELVGKLHSAENALGFYGCTDGVVLGQLAPSATALLFAGRLPAVPVHPEIR